MNRFEANKEILDIIKKDSRYKLLTDIYSYVTFFQNQRFGQIICNYICPDYRSGNVSENTKKIMDWIFPNNPDPFFEESTETLNRIRNDN